MMQHGAGYGHGPPAMGMGHHMMQPGPDMYYGGKGGPAYGAYGPPPQFGGPAPGYGGKGGLPGPQAFIGQQLEGHVVSWKDMWGFIASPIFGGDIFAHKDDLKGSGLPS